MRLSQFVQCLHIAAYATVPAVVLGLQRNGDSPNRVNVSANVKPPKPECGDMNFVTKQKKCANISIDTLCPANRFLSAAPVRFQKNDAHYNGPRSCSSDVGVSTRVVLVSVVPSFHGSTALLSTMMSSKRVSTLCNAKTWECEGHRIRGYKANESLQTWTRYWDPRNPVFFDKGPRTFEERSAGANPDRAKLGAIFSQIQEANQNMGSVLPNLLANGISKLEDAYAIMWRPLCLANLDDHYREGIQEWSKEGMTKTLVELMVDQMNAYQYLKQRGKPVIVINLADLIWRPGRNRQRLEEFIPCIGSVDMDYLPKVGEDVSVCNQFKLVSSVSQFGKTIIPDEDCGYDVSSMRCNSGLHDIASYLDAETAALHAAAHKFLVELS